jgi:hypothetical protein
MTDKKKPQIKKITKTLPPSPGAIKDNIQSSGSLKLSGAGVAELSSRKCRLCRFLDIDAKRDISELSWVDGSHLVRQHETSRGKPNVEWILKFDFPSAGLKLCLYGHAFVWRLSQRRSVQSLLWGKEVGIG